MENKIKKIQDVIRENWDVLKGIRKQGIVTEEQQKKLAEVMNSDEIAEYVSERKEKASKYINQKRNWWKQSEWFQEVLKTRKEDISLINKVAERMGDSFEEAYNTLHGGDELKKKESKEKMKTPQLEKENHKIDKGMSVDEKLKNGWKKEKNVPAYIDGVEKKVTVLKKTIEWWAKDAFVWEYIDDGVMSKNMVGEQLFNRNAVLNLWLQTKLPSFEQMETIRGGKEKHQEFLKNNFQKNWENLFPGYWGPDFKEFYDISGRTGCWLSDGNNIGVSKDDILHYGGNPRFGLSLRVLKD